MFDKTKIQTALNGLIGIQNPINPLYAIVNSDNQISRSGRFVTENPFCKVEFIKDNSDYKLQTNEQFNMVLANLMNSAISKVCDNVFNSNDYIDRQMLYENANNKVLTDSLPSGFVGYEVEKSTRKNIGFKISRVICEFYGTGTVTLYLFNSARQTPIQTKVVNISSEYQDVTLNWVFDNTTQYAGKWYIGYLTDGLTVSPYKRAYKDSIYKSEIKELEINSISVLGVSSPVLFDFLTERYNTETWGLNFDITVFEDFTDLIIQNEMLFANAIQLQAQINWLEVYRASIRGNENERISKEMIVEVEGIDITDGLKKVGLKNLMLGQIKSIQSEIEKLRTNYKPLALQMQTFC